MHPLFRKIFIVGRAFRNCAMARDFHRRRYLEADLIVARPGRITAVALAALVVSISACQPPPPPDLPDWQLMVNPFPTPAAPGTGSYNVAVVPTTWTFRFTNGNHHLREHSLRPKSIQLNRAECWMDWYSTMTFHDKNWDDPVKWQVQYTIVALPNSFMHYGEGKAIKQDGGPHSFDASLTREGLKGFDAATVALIGWEFGYWDKDHHVRKMGVRIKDVAYDPNEGKVSWTVRYAFADKNADDDIYWRYDFLVVAFNDGEAIPYTIREKRRAVNVGRTVQLPQGSRQKVAVLPQGWFYDADSDDEHVRRHDYRLTANASPDGNAVYFTPEVFFPRGRLTTDLNTGEVFIWPEILELDVVALFFDNGGVGHYPSFNMLETTTYLSEYGVGWRSHRFSLDPPQFPWCSN
jgi:hypothetical protein